MRKISAVVTSLFAALAVAAPTASASDESLRAAVKAADAKVKPDAVKFVKAARRFKRTKKAGPLRVATRRLIADVDQVRASVSKEEASSDQVRRGKEQWLAALRKLRRGLRVFDRALRSFQARNFKKLNEQLRVAQRLINRADAQGDRAEKLMGVES